MSGLFGGGSQSYTPPAPVPVSPLSPVTADNTAAQAARDAATADTLRESQANGRRSLISGGARMALDARQEKEARKILG